MGMENGLSVADALALDKSDGAFGGNGAWMMMCWHLISWR